MSDGVDHNDSLGVGAVMLAVITCCLSAALWGVIRAYTGIFDVLNLRVFVAAFVVALPLVAVPAVAYSLTGWRKAFAFVLLFAAALPIAGGEWFGSWLSGQPIVWQRFNLIWLGIELALALFGCIGTLVKAPEKDRG